MSTSSVSATGSSNVLSQDDYLQLMVSQLTQQDPLNPTSNTEFAAQLAQYSALEQNKQINSGISTLNSSQALSQAQAMLGETVTLKSGDSTITGVVQGVQVVNGTPKINVDGTLYNVSDVTGISLATANANAVTHNV
jgi:flagellar basal-body rod modification protein FlgD